MFFFFFGPDGITPNSGLTGPNNTHSHTHTHTHTHIYIQHKTGFFTILQTRFSELIKEFEKVNFRWVLLSKGP